MQKLKLNTNAVGGAAHSDQLNQKGITLIALIITIIVMLILVGVTINVALNGGLFQKAEDAKTLTQLAADKEELQIEIATAYDEKEREVNFTTLATNLGNKGWNVTISGDEAICTSSKGNTFTVDKQGKIEDGGNGSGGGNEPESFNWGTVKLDNVEIGADYKFYDNQYDTLYVMNFDEDGEIILKANGAIVETYSAKEYINEDGYIMIPFTRAGTSYDTILKMDGENINAELIGLATVSYKKVK